MFKKFVLSILALFVALSAIAQNDMFGRPLFGADGSHISYVLNRDGSWTERIDAIDGSVSFAPRPLDHTSVSGPIARPKSHSEFEFGAWQVIDAFDSHESAIKFYVTPQGKRRVACITDFYFDDLSDYHLFVYEHNSATNTWDEVRPGGWVYDTRYHGGEGLTVADLNKDGELDIIVGHQSGITLFLATSGSTDYNVQPLVAVGRADVVIAADVNHDDNTDIISLPWADQIMVSYGDGVSGFVMSESFVSTHRGFNCMVRGDVDGDGQEELVVMSGQGLVPNFTIFEIAPGIPFVSEHYVDDPANHRELTRSIAIGDFNNDDRNDIELSNSALLYEYRQNTDGTLPDLPGQITTYNIAESLETTAVDCVDSLADLVVAHGGWNRVGLYLQEPTGLGGELLFTLPYASHYDPDRGIDLGDGNGDGIVDLFVADYNNGFLFLPGQCSPAVVDTDGDTVPDSADCFPSDATRSVPAEVTGVRVWKTAPAPTAVAMTWDFAEGNVDITTGVIAELHQDSSFARATCLTSSLLPGGVYVDNRPGSNWYLLRARCDVTAGTYGMSFRGPDAEAWLNTNSPCP